MAPFTHTLRVRYNECDPQGIVFNANYVVYIDVALTELWRDLFGSYESFVNETGIDLVVADLQIRFRKAARWDEVLAITLAPTLTSASSVTSAITIRRGDDIIIEGTARHVCVDASTLAKIAAPNRLSQALA
ncbi:acyl-CoA thioesterase [Luteipulveratus mongoliensis]|uniref:Thioesterase domain-containing protein n=1 Tax=Luteipulveratus mongoliensis TaxID=571913 RepID=A0A0K1JF34_9MICO|nr:thioesterase family protein [Luteipulveratus mongoliensis]AKU15332.1 hypothetical protein VV02_04750 [Luteipulveratus mongoliensis]